MAQLELLQLSLELFNLFLELLPNEVEVPLRIPLQFLLLPLVLVSQLPQLLVFLDPHLRLHILEVELMLLLLPFELVPEPLKLFAELALAVAEAVLGVAKVFL